MELLFTDTTGTSELKEHLGFLDLSLDYKNIKAKIITASNDVKKIIGQTMYNLALAEYKKSDEDNSKNIDLIFYVKNPIAIQAYRKYAPHNDLSHTTSGRLNRLEDGQKSPFEWMIDKDDKALEKSYYEALDDLIEFLEANIESWKETPQYKKSHQLFIKSANDFDDIFPIGASRLLFLKLSPGIRIAESKEITPRLGKELFDTLKESPDENEVLVAKIKEALAYYAMAWALRRLSVQLFPEGIIEGFMNDMSTKPIKSSNKSKEVFAAASYFEIDAHNAFLEIEELITKLNKTADEVVEPLTFKASSSDSFFNT